MKETTVMEWTPTTVLRKTPWENLVQLWVRVRSVESPDEQRGLIGIREVTDTEWRPL